MIPIGDENPTLRTPFMTLAILGAIIAVWVFVQGAGLDPTVLATSVCNLGMVPGEITKQAALGVSIPMGVHNGQQWVCAVDNWPGNYLTPITSMFLHGGW